MRIIKLIPVIAVLQSCIPSFAPEEVLNKEIKQGSISVKWVDLIGIMDQDYPDLITIQAKKRTDTICRAHNITNIAFVQSDTILVVFSGIPIKYGKPIAIPDSKFGYKIKIDTTGVPSKEHLPERSSLNGVRKHNR